VKSAQTRSWKGQTFEERAAQRRDQLVDAAVELIGTAGVSAVTLRAVCGEAGLSLRFFYESFGDFDQLIVAAYDTTLARLRAAIESAPAGSVDARAQLHAAFDAAAELVETDPRVGRILFREPFAHDVLRGHAVATIPLFFLGVLSSAFHGLELPTDLQVSAASGALINLFLNWTEGMLGTDRARFVDHCTDVALRLLW
jgi:AcrR family transcriptional regulator